jgi:outer membrane protein OmpA-like peptidoglycan-associated protein
MLGVSALAVAGCSQLPGASLGATWTAEDYLAAEHGGAGFTGALASEYTEAGRNWANMDRWMNATAFIAKAQQAEGGSAPAPWSPDQLGVNGEAAELYDRAVATITENAEEYPQACARAQAMWDLYLTLLRAEANGAQCPITSEEVLAMLNEALAACDPVPQQADFTVYFGFDRSNLTADAIETVEEVVDTANEMDANAISVVGHTDTVGSVQYNQALSERRARSVAEALVERGIPADIMTLAGRSELEPARVTGDGVREQLNRRAEISLSE